MVRTFNDDMAAEISGAFLNTNEFAEQIDYHPANGGKVRTITALVSRGSKRIDDATHHLGDLETADFLVARNAETGMDDPRLGDAVRIGSDVCDRKWDFVQIVACDAVSFTVQFRRSKITRGGQQQPARM